MAITKSDIAKLLALTAAYDQRTVGHADVEAWFEVADISRWNFAATRRVIIEHYARGADRPRIDAATISDRIRAIRGAAAESFEAPQIPAGLANADYPAWLRRQLGDHVDRQIDTWATTGAEPSRAQPVEPALIGSLNELIAAAPAHTRPELEAGVRRVQARKVRLDPHHREEAAVELDRIRRDQGDTA